MKIFLKAYLVLALIISSGASVSAETTSDLERWELGWLASTKQAEVDEVLDIALGHVEIAEIIKDKILEVAETKPVIGTEVELTINFPEHFEFRGQEIAQLKVFVDTATKSVIGFYFLDKGVIPYPAGGRVVLTEIQEKRGLEIALDDPLVTAFLEGKNYTVTRMDGMPVWSSDFTGKPGVSMTFTFDRDYDFDGDIYHPPYADEDTYHLKATVRGLDVISNLQWGQVVHMWPHVSSVPMPASQLLLYGGIVAGSLIIGLGVYLYLRRAGFRNR